MRSLPSLRPNRTAKTNESVNTLICRKAYSANEDSHRHSQRIADNTRICNMVASPKHWVRFRSCAAGFSDVNQCAETRRIPELFCESVARPDLGTKNGEDQGGDPRPSKLANPVSHAEGW